MGEYDTLLSFLDGLQVWARMELKRRGMQDLAMVIATVKSSIEFKIESSKGQVKKTYKDSNYGGDMEGSPKETNLPDTKVIGRRIRLQRRSHLSFATGLIRFLSTRCMVNIALLS